MDDSALLIATIAGVLVAFMVGVLVLYARCAVQVPQGQALVITRSQGTAVSFDTALVLPIVHRAERIDLSLKTLQISRRGSEGVVCRDNIRADLSMTFYLRVGRTADDVLKVAQSIGCARAGEQSTLEELFVAKLVDALASVAKQRRFEELYSERDAFRDEVIARVGRDLGGWVLDDVALDFLEQTPIEQLDPNNILDAEGIRTITERTSEERIATATREQQIQRHVSTLEHELKELLIEQEARRKDALGRFAEVTGRSLTEQQLDEEIDRRLRDLLDARSARDSGG